MRGIIRGVMGLSAAAEGDEVSERIGQGGVEGLEGEGLRGVEACGVGGVEVHERGERGQRLIDRGPAECSLIAVVVGGIDALGDSLDAGDVFDGTAELRGYAGTDDARECAVVALDAHNAGRGDPQIARAEVSHADEIGRDESVLEGDENVEGGLGVGEHLRGIEELGEGCDLLGDRLLEKIVGHLFLTSGDQVALIVRCERFEEGSDVDDVGVGSDSECFGDLCGDEDVAIALLQVIVFGLHAVVVVVLLGCGFGGESA